MNPAVLNVVITGILQALDLGLPLLLEAKRRAAGDPAVELDPAEVDTFLDRVASQAEARFRGADANLSASVARFRERHAAGDVAAG